MNVRLDKDTITPELKRLFKEVKRPLALYQAGAKEVQRSLVDHLRQLQTRGNAKGWPEQYFFARGRNSVEKNVGIAHVSATGAEITIADPRFVHRITGGRVEPKRRKFLAIPLTAEAYAVSGKGSIRESMPGLRVWKFKKGLYLVREEQEKLKGGKRRWGASKTRTRVILLFKLVKSVTHRPHPDEMPNSEKLGAAARGAMEQAARVLLAAKA